MNCSSKNKVQPFLQALTIQRGDLVCITGAGGKTSLMFRLAQEARAQGFRVLVTTSTLILVPNDDQCDALDLSGSLFSETSVELPGIYVGGVPSPVADKMTGVNMELLVAAQKRFDLLLMEADGAANKPLKGWNPTEPVIPLFATKTVGVLDIQTVGSIISEDLVHRLEKFSEITGGKTGESVSIDHLSRIVLHDIGLFHQSQGQKILYINKVESEADHRNADKLVEKLVEKLENFLIVAGSIQQGKVYV